MPARLGDQLAVGVLADEHVECGAGVMVGRQQHVFMPEGVDVTPAEAAPGRLAVLPERPIAVAQMPIQTRTRQATANPTP